MITTPVERKYLPKCAVFQGCRAVRWREFKKSHKRKGTTPFEFAKEWFKQGGTFYHKVPKSNKYYLLTEVNEWIGFAALALDNTNLDRESKARWESVFKVQRPVKGGPKDLTLAPVIKKAEYVLCEPKDVDDRLSWLRVVTTTNVILLFLSVWEIYSAKDLDKYLHGRHIAGEPRVKNNTDTRGLEVVRIPSSISQHIDEQGDILHVIRDGCPVHVAMKRQSRQKNSIFHKGPATIDFTLLINVLMHPQVGAPDKTRSPDSRRLNLTLGQNGQLNGFPKVVDNFGPVVADQFFEEIGKVCEFLCVGMQEIQKAAGREPLFSDVTRDFGFAERIRLLLKLPRKSPMCAELIVVCVMALGEPVARNYEHKDSINCKEYPYSKSGTFSAVVKNKKGELFLFQIIIAGRNYAQSVAVDDMAYKYTRHI